MPTVRDSDSFWLPNDRPFPSIAILSYFLRAYFLMPYPAPISMVIFNFQRENESTGAHTIMSKRRILK